MASKQKKKAGGRPPVAQGAQRAEVERLIAKGWLKDAVKQAKIYHRDEPSPESHRLLERAYYLRADELRRNGMPAAAQEVAHHLLDFGVTDPDLVEPAARLVVTLGISRGAGELLRRVESPEVQARLVLEACDQAVLHRERSAAAPAEVRAGAAAVHEALTALDAGDEPRAVAALRDITRASPFADWKLFVRGLAAHYRGDHAEARANWDRLDPQRAAARIVRALPGAGGAQPAGTLELLEKACFGDPVLEPLDQMRRLIGEGDWHGALRHLSALRIRLRRIDPKLAERLARALYTQLLHDAGDFDEDDLMRLVREFRRASEPIAIDPNWNRFQGILYEGPHGTYEDAEDAWRRYVQDLQDLPLVPPAERVLAQALVLAHLGKMYAHFADELSLPGSPFGTPPEDPEYERRRAVACLEEGIRLAPQHRATYHTLLHALERWEDLDEAAAVARRLLEPFPDDYAALTCLVDHHMRRDEPEQALDYARRARSLKPLDREASRREATVRTTLSRHLALQGRFDDACAELDEAARVYPEWGRTPAFGARRVAVELKAGQAQRASQLLSELQEGLAEPAPVWLALLIEGSRHQLAQAELDRFEAQWRAALARKPRPETASGLAALMVPFFEESVKYPGKDVHVKQVLDYVRRASGVKFTRPDELENVCRFLTSLPKERPLLEKMAARGLKLFPKSPVFQTISGVIEIMKGPVAGGNLRRARQHFQKALALARADNNPEHAALVPRIQEKLSMIDTMMDTLPKLGAMLGRSPAEVQEMLDALEEEFSQRDDEDAPPSPGRRNTRKG